MRIGVKTYNQRLNIKIKKYALLTVTERCIYKFTYLIYIFNLHIS